MPIQMNDPACRYKNYFDEEAAGLDVLQNPGIFYSLCCPNGVK
jgi:hypothetical protein